MGAQFEHHRYKNGTKAFGNRRTIFNVGYMKPHLKAVAGGKNGEAVTKTPADPERLKAYRKQRDQEIADRYKRK